jgi:hypothetical protein
MVQGMQWTTKNSSIYIENSNVGIGTSTPLYDLHVHVQSYFNSNVTVNGLLSTRGNIASVSDQRVKTNLDPIVNALDKVEKLNGYTYYRTDINRRECGLIAQQVQDVLPEVVFEVPDMNMLTISYGNMAGLFVEAMKEMKQRIESLESEINQLKSSRS